PQRQDGWNARDRADIVSHDDLIGNRAVTGGAGNCQYVAVGPGKDAAVRNIEVTRSGVCLPLVAQNAPRGAHAELHSGASDICLGGRLSRNYRVIVNLELKAIDVSRKCVHGRRAAIDSKHKITAV